MDFTRGGGRPPGRRYWCLPCAILCGTIILLTILVVSLVSYIDYGGNIARFAKGEPDATRELPGPGYPGSPDPDEQLAMASGDVPEELVVQEGQLHARGDDDPARKYAEQGQVAEHETDADEVLGAKEQRRQFKLPKLPIPSGIIDIPKLIPTRVKDILSDLPPVPTIPTDPGDIVDQLPDPGELISDLPVPSLPTIPAIPTLPVPIPIPTEVPELPVPTKIPTKIPELPMPTVPDVPGWPLPTGKPGDPKDIYKLPDLTEIPHKVLDLLHGAISKLSTDESTPKYLRDVLRFILRIINRLAGGEPKPKPPAKPPAKPPVPTAPTLTLPLPIPTLPLPTIIPTDLPVPTLPTDLPTRTLTRLPPLPTLPPLPLPTLTLAPRQRKQQPGSEDGGAAVKRKLRGKRGGSKRGGGGDKEPLSDERRKELRDAVSDEVWAAADWSNPLVASVTAAWAMVAFDAIYRVADAFKATDDEAEKERLLGSIVVVDDEVIEGVA